VISFVFSSWISNEFFKYYIIPISTGSDGVEDSDADQCIIHYVIVDIWDKDTLNRDDFMGRVMVPVSLLTHESYCGWVPLGRTSTRDAQFTGEIYLELRIKSQLVRLCYIIIMFAEISLILFSDHNSPQAGAL
jgi:hypothetical protein